MARPVNEDVFQERISTGIDIVLAIDVSKSMLTRDFERNRVTRMQAARETAKVFSQSRPNDRMGLVGFAGRPFVSSPITLEHEWLRNEVDNLDPMAPELPGGTAIGSAIATASNRLKKREAKSKVIILVTDGANNSGRMQPLEAAKLAADLGIKIYTIAIGSAEGRLSGQIISKAKQEFDPKTLQSIADLTGGEYYHVKNTQEEFEKTFETINQLEKTESKVRTTVETTEYHHWFSRAALCFTALALLAQALRSSPGPE